MNRIAIFVFLGSACGGDGGTPRHDDDSGPPAGDATSPVDDNGEPVDDTRVLDDTLGGDAATADTSDTGDVGLARCEGGVERELTTDGGMIELEGARLEVPAGALSEPTTICVRPSAATPPAGYRAYTSMFELEPDGLVFALPALLTLDLPSAVETPAVFLSGGGPAYEWRGGSLGAQTISASISHFSNAFAGDGVDYVDPIDTGCTKVRLVDPRSLGGVGGLALFVQVDDCAGNPITGLTPQDFVVREDGLPLTSEASVYVLPQPGALVFVTIVIDVSSSIASALPTVLTAARAFVEEIESRELPPVRYAIELLDGSRDNEVWLDFTDDTTQVFAKIASIVDFAPPEGSSTNLYGGIIGALDRSKQAQTRFRVRSAGGSLSIGHVLLFTDGRDTSGRASLEEAAEELAESPIELAVVGLDGVDFDASSLQALASGRLFSASDMTALTTAFGAMANRIAGQIARTYLIGYCTPKRDGVHEVSLATIATESTPATWTFDASGYVGGCDAATFAEACDARECGGLGCGVCAGDDRCEGGIGRCSGVCTWWCDVPGTNVVGEVTGTVYTCVDECDGDGIPGDIDVCPFHDDPNQTGTACADDPDGDRVVGAADLCPDGASGWQTGIALDFDRDGCRDADEDPDDDNDGGPDVSDLCPETPVGATDFDHDGCPNALDGDDDDDGLPDTLDPCDFSSGEDLDGDGCANDEDGDDDGDGRSDWNDDCPQGATGWLSSAGGDYDLDGCRDASEDLDDDDDGHPDMDDRCPLGTKGTNYTDVDDDGCRDGFDQPPAGQDFDGDGLLDVVDTCPHGAEGWTSNTSTDLDGDGCRTDEDPDDDADGVVDTADACPNKLLTADHDHDGCNDEDDDDDDNDSEKDAFDACPRGVIFTQTSSTDRDGDGCRTDEDPDDDNDGLLDAADQCDGSTANLNWTSSPATDHDGDGCRDAGSEDTNDDNDPVLDASDACPTGAIGWTASPVNDLDTNGCRDGVDEPDPDIDGDRKLDAADGCLTNPTGDWFTTSASDRDSDGCRDSDQDDDDDGDGLGDTVDACPLGVVGGQNDVDGDGCSASEDADDDGDGVIDLADKCPLTSFGWSSDAAQDLDHDGCRDVDEDDNDDGDGYPDEIDACPAELGYRVIADNDDGDGCNDPMTGDPDGDGVTSDVCANGSVEGCTCTPVVGICAHDVVDIVHAPARPWVAGLAASSGVCVMSDGFVRLYGADGAQVRVWPTAVAAGSVVGVRGSSSIDCVFHDAFGPNIYVFDDSGSATRATNLDNNTATPGRVVATANWDATIEFLVYENSRTYTTSLSSTNGLFTSIKQWTLPSGSNAEAAAFTMVGNVRCVILTTGAPKRATIECDSSHAIDFPSRAGDCLLNPAGIAVGGKYVVGLGPQAWLQVEDGTVVGSTCVGVDAACAVSTPHTVGWVSDAQCVTTVQGDSLVTCQAGHFKSELPIVRGDATVEVLDSHVVDGSTPDNVLLVSSTLGGVDTISTVRVKPCTSPCDDGDLCTSDSGTAGACSNVQLATPACGTP